MKFRSKPKEIEAEQFFPDKPPWPPGVHSDPSLSTGWYVRNELHNSKIEIKPGDFVRTDLPGDLYPIDREYMAKNYEPVGVAETKA
jgi:hypothetical protein